jgi:(2Fe-2S) ferredoxin
MARSKEIEKVLVCTNVDCAVRGSPAMLEQLTTDLAAAGSPVQVKSYLCFGACQDGPNIVLYPEGSWYMGIQQGDIPEIEQHILGGEPVARLTERVDPNLRDLILEILESGMVDI